MYSHNLFHSHIQIEPTSDTEYLSMKEMFGIYLYTSFVTAVFD